MKRLLVISATVILSLIITFVTFEMLSLYHFGDFPTKVVLIRLIVYFCMSEALMLGAFALIKKSRK